MQDKVGTLPPIPYRAGMDERPPSQIAAFISRWQTASAGERAQSQSFLLELCDALAVDRPSPETESFYRFEYPVALAKRHGSETTGWIDLYRKGCFVLESKQSRQPGGNKAVDVPGLFGTEAAPSQRGRRSSSRAWDVLMMNARRQAEDYARYLPADHGWPPFVIVCDVGHCFELYADFSGLGKYRQFPDRQGFRVYLEDLHKPELQDVFRAIWTAPQSLDPTARAARVTRDIARRLALVSKALEDRGADPEQVAMFLMRCLFTMFAEDVALLPERSFRTVLERCEDDPSIFPPMVQQLWQAMDKGDFAFAIEQKVRRFNGNLFADATVFELGREEIGELRAAAAADWKEVEPAIFGTLLEQALNPHERKRLGAHYTPRAYVELLVNATVIEPLGEEWMQVQSTAERLRAAGDEKAARTIISRFHDKLCETRVLDPACGTGNFLYVALELMKRLEGEVLDALVNLGGQEALTALEGHAVDPHQFLGLELNPRAAAISELVLWIGFLQWHFRTRGSAPSEPILRRFRNIEVKDAVLEWDGYPSPQVTDGRESYPNPRRPEWPDAEYIVGNPPFIGGKDIRSRLGDPYVEALWTAHPQMNEAADYVMYWWDRAAELLARKGAGLKRFGLVTTNSISQVFQRRAVERHLKAKQPISLVLAIPDHPWTKATKDAAAVRIAMTVAEAGSRIGVLRETVREEGLDTDDPQVELDERRGRINSDMTIGVDVTAAVPLKASQGICSPGVKLHGSGFIITPQQAGDLGLGRRPGLEKHIRPYRNGRDLTAKPRNVMVIDLFGLAQEEVRSRFPEVYQHLMRTVKVQRDNQVVKSGTRDAKEYAERWWVFGKSREELRPALAGLRRYIATVETAKHRVFQFLDATILPDNMLICIGSDDAFHLGVLSSRIHVAWAPRAGGWLGVGNDPRYSKSRCFDPFPFPEPDSGSRAEISRIAEAIDAHRKERQGEHPGLTLTQMYNVLERLGHAELTPPEERIRDQGLLLILKELHDELDSAVAQAYGWPSALSDDDLISRLVALNEQRAREEARRVVRWLRPVYQISRFGTQKERAEQVEAELVSVAAKASKPAFPTDPVGQTAAIMAALYAAERPVSAAEIAKGFRQGRKVENKVAETLAAIARMGHYPDIPPKLDSPAQL